MNSATIDWDQTAKLATFVVAAAALALSAFNLWRQRRRVRVRIWVRHIRTAAKTHEFEVTVANTGNVAFSVRQAFHNPVAARKRSGVVEILYEHTAGSPELRIAAGELISIHGTCTGDVRQERRVFVRLHDDSVFSTPFRFNQQYAQNWVSFLLYVFERVLPEYGVTYVEGIAEGLLYRCLEFVDKNTGAARGVITGINPIETHRTVAAFQVSPSGEAHTHPPGTDELYRRIAERLPDIFQLDESNSEEIPADYGDEEVAYALQYTRFACESYASDTGGHEIFNRYGFDPLKYIPPRRLPIVVPATERVRRSLRELLMSRTS